MADSSLQADVLRKLATAEIPSDLKIEILLDLSKRYLPPDNTLRSRIQNLKPSPPGTIAITGPDPNDLIEAAAFWLESMGPYVPPVVPDAPPEKAATIRLADPRDIETEVRLYVDEKFTKSPYFIGMVGILAICATLFSCGLMNLNKDVRSASEIVTKMQEQLGTERAAMAAAQDKQSAEIAQKAEAFNSLMNATEGRISASEKNVTSTIDAKFKLESEEVGRKKNETLATIASEEKDATEKITRATDTAADKISSRFDSLTAANIKKLNDHALELYFQLQTPTWRQMAFIGFKANWPAWAAAFLALVVSVFAMRRTRSHRGEA